MANIYGRSTATFKPYSFEEMLKPALMATETHNKLEEYYSTLETLTADLEAKLSKNPKDAQLRATYNNYKEALNQASEELYNKGLTTSSRKAFNRLKTEYGEKINPIQEAYKKYIEQQDFINKLAVTNPEVLITGAGESISDYMGDTLPKLSSVNLNTLTAQALAEAKADSARTYRESNWKPTAGGRYQERFTSTGLTDEQFDAAIKNLDDYNAKKTNVLSEDAAAMQNIINNVIGGSNYNSLSDTQKLKALDAIKAGIRSGYAYDKKLQTQVDPMFAYNLKVKEERAKQAAKRKALLEQIGTDTFITSQEGRSEFINEYLNTDGSLKEPYASYFKNGKLKSREEVLKEQKDIYDKPIDRLWGVDGFDETAALQRGLGLSSGPSTLDYDRFIEKLGLIGLDASTVSEKAISKQLSNSGDAIAIDRQQLIPDEGGKTVLQQRIETAKNNGEQLMRVTGITTDANGIKTYKTKPVDYEDLLTGKNEELNILTINGALGQGTAKIKTDDGIIEIVLPDGVYHNSGISGISDADSLKSIDIELQYARKGYAFNPETKKYEPVDIRDIIELPSGEEGTIYDLIAELEIQKNNILSGTLGKNASFKLSGE